ILSFWTGGVFCLFFFSSRRRQTRWPRDWSSDVCSSDLTLPSRLTIAAHSLLSRPPLLGPPLGFTAALTAVTSWSCVTGQFAAGRSEERRVGKECRSRWWAES